MLIYQLINQHINAIRQLREEGKDLSAAEHVLQAFLEEIMPIGTKVGFTSIYARLYLAWGPYAVSIDLLEDGFKVHEGQKAAEHTFTWDNPTLPTVKDIFTKILMREVL